MDPEERSRTRMPATPAVSRSASGLERPLFHRILRSLRRPAATTTTPHVRSAQRTIATCHALVSERGEVSGARLASEALSSYLTLEAPAVDAFFDLLVEHFSPDPDIVLKAVDEYGREQSLASLMRLQSAVEPPSQELFRRFNMAPGATAALVEMRRRLLRTLGEHPERAGIDSDLAHLFRSWFNRGFLVLQRIDWRTSAL